MLRLVAKLGLCDSTKLNNKVESNYQDFLDNLHSRFQY